MSFNSVSKQVEKLTRKTKSLVFIETGYTLIHGTNLLFFPCAIISQFLRVNLLHRFQFSFVQYSRLFDNIIQFFVPLILFLDFVHKLSEPKITAKHSLNDIFIKILSVLTSVCAMTMTGMEVVVRLFDCTKNNDDLSNR